MSPWSRPTRALPLPTDTPTAPRMWAFHMQNSAPRFTDLCHGFPTGQNVSNVGVKISCSMEILSGPWGGGAANARCSAPTLRRKRGVQHNTRRVTRLQESPLNRFLCDSVLPLHDKLARVINTALPDTTPPGPRAAPGAAAFPPPGARSSDAGWGQTVREATNAGPSAAGTFRNCPAAHVSNYKQPLFGHI